MKFLWLHLGLVGAIILQALGGMVWQRPPLTLAGTLSGAALACAVGLLYLHVPDAKRRVRAGLILGSILGLLIGLYRSLDGFDASVVSYATPALETLRTWFAGALSGTAIAFFEAKFNRSRTDASGTHARREA